ncbi:aldose epimerase family protein [Bifidobacterium callitrichidarum]|nr:aldose epimerase family protein [Bifidobacterium callitrichidarum]
MERIDITDSTGHGISTSVTDYGARLMAVIVPDRDGNPTNVLLGLPTVDDYAADDCYLGAIIGRNANRIARARCVIGGETHRLAANEDTNSSHSGPDGYEHRRWTVIEHGRGSVTLALTSPDGDQGFPGTMDIQARYGVAGNALDLVIDADCDRTTIANMTNHAYWNLSGEGSGDMLDQELQIFTDRFCPTNERFIPLPHAPVEGTAMDFRAPRVIGEALRSGLDTGDEQILAARGYNHAFVFEDAAGQLPGAATLELSRLDGSKPDGPGHPDAPDASGASGSPREPANSNGMRKLASAYSPRTGIRMTQYANAPAVLFYSAGFMENVLGTSGHTYGPSAGYALEPGFVPNSINDPSELSPELPAGQHYQLHIRWEFETENPSAQQMFRTRNRKQQGAD